MSGSDSTYAAIISGGCTVLEHVLLAIIEAHTTQETDGRQGERLEAAMAALIGPATARERDMERALQYMVRQRQRNACDLEMAALGLCGDASPQAALSVSELAATAAREILGITAADKVQATADILCEMFRRRGKVHAVTYDHVREALEAEAVRQILGELAEWHIPSIRQN